MNRSALSQDSTVAPQFALKRTQTLDNVAEQACPSGLLSLPRRDSPAAFALLYLALRRLTGWALGSPTAPRTSRSSSYATSRRSCIVRFLGRDSGGAIVFS
jgi:hypothetical protein